MLENSNAWSSTNLNILVVPSVHGPIANAEGGVLPEGAEGAAPGGAYLDATLELLDDWRYALDKTAELAAGSDAPRWAADIGWVSEITWSLDIVSENIVGPEDVQNADIVKFYTETTFPILGAAVYADPCLAYSTEWNTYGSLTYRDTYNLAGHELLHCFGMSHPEEMQPEADIMSYEDTPWVDYRCPSNLDPRAVAAAFAGAVDGPGVSPGQTVAVDADAYEQNCLNSDED